MMKYRKLEIALLAAKNTRNIEKIEDIKTILAHRQRMLDMKLEKTMVGSRFEKSPVFKDCTEEYSQIQRLYRIASAYAWC